MNHAMLFNRLRSRLRFVVEAILTLEGQEPSDFISGQLLELRVERQWLADLLEEIERQGGV